VLHRRDKTAGQRRSDLRMCGGQGRGRTADLPIFSLTLGHDASVGVRLNGRRGSRLSGFSQECVPGLSQPRDGRDWQCRRIDVTTTIGRTQSGRTAPSDA
jgi:hypothetical protein